MSNQHSCFAPFNEKKEKKGKQEVQARAFQNFSKQEFLLQFLVEAHYPDPHLPNKINQRLCRRGPGIHMKKKILSSYIA